MANGHKKKEAVSLEGAILNAAFRDLANATVEGSTFSYKADQDGAIDIASVNLRGRLVYNPDGGPSYSQILMVSRNNKSKDKDSSNMNAGTLAYDVNLPDNLNSLAPSLRMQELGEGHSIVVEQGSPLPSYFGLTKPDERGTRANSTIGQLNDGTVIPGEEYQGVREGKTIVAGESLVRNWETTYMLGGVLAGIAKNVVVAPEGKIFRYKNGSYLLVDAQGQIVKGNIPLDGRQVIEEEITKEVADESNLDDSHVGKKYTQVLDKTRAENGIVTFEGKIKGDYPPRP